MWRVPLLDVPSVDLGAVGGLFCAPQRAACGRPAEDVAITVQSRVESRGYSPCRLGRIRWDRTQIDLTD